MVQGVAGGIAGAVGAGIANSQDPQGPRIKELAGLQGSGRLDRTDTMLVNQEYAADRRASDAAAQQTADQLAGMGTTSGRDVASLTSANQGAAQAATDKASARFAQAFGAEGQELADRKAIRHDRAMEVTNYIQSGLSGASSNTGSAAGAQVAMGAKPNMSALPADAGKTVSALQAALANGTITQAEYEQYMKSIAGTAAASSASAAFGAVQ